MVEEFIALTLIDLTSEIVSAYVKNNPIPPTELPRLIADVHLALKSSTTSTNELEAEAPKPAVNPKKSVYPDYVVCPEDGKKFKSLKKHLRVYHELTPDEYRKKWGLANDYPLVAPNYGARRSALAKKMDFGRRRRRR
jgi:predicted transcriptional regulator